VPGEGASRYSWSAAPIGHSFLGIDRANSVVPTGTGRPQEVLMFTRLRVLVVPCLALVVGLIEAGRRWV
jgi:hypothetical protein